MIPSAICSALIAKARVLLGLSFVYERSDHQFAINALSDAVNTINHLEDPDILSTSLIRQIKTDNHMFFAVFEMPGYGLEEVFKQVSKNDLEIPYANAKALQDRYFRTLAVIGVAQNCIDRNKPVIVKKNRK